MYSFIRLASSHLQDGRAVKRGNGTDAFGRNTCEDRMESSRHHLLRAGQALGNVIAGGPGNQGTALGTVSLVWDRRQRRESMESGGHI